MFDRTGFVAGDVAALLGLSCKPWALVLDPPRRGLDGPVDAILETPPELLAYLAVMSPPSPVISRDCWRPRGVTPRAVATD